MTTTTTTLLARKNHVAHMTTAAAAVPTRRIVDARIGTVYPTKTLLAAAGGGYPVKSYRV